jgi:hypothetical protein
VQSADDSSSVVSFKIEEEEIRIKEEEESIADDSSSVVSFKIEEEEIHLKEEEAPIALLSSIKDEPEVSPQTFHQYIGFLSVILPFSLPAFPHKSAHNVNGNGLYIFRESVKCEG